MSETTMHAAARPPRLGGPAVKLGAAAVLILLLQIPLLLVSGLIAERQAREQEVVGEIARSWGPAQAITGPTLAIPYDWTEAGTQAASPVRHRSWIDVPTSALTVTAALVPETRRRGLFHATVYTARVSMDGTITIPAPVPHEAAEGALRWNEAVLAVGASDLRGQPASGTVQLGERTLPLAVVSAGGGAGGVAAAPAGFAAAPAPGTKLAVKAELVLRGTQSFAVLPWGQQIAVHARAPWPSPSFTGSALPTTYDVTPDDFRADWELSGTAGAAWRESTRILPSMDDETGIGVDLIEAVPTYQMVTRAAKYGTLFLVLAFLTYFLIEQRTGLSIHLAQYALLGLSVTMFALLLVATAEPFGFNAGYALSTTAVMAQASLYTLSVTGRVRLAALLAAVLGLLFGVLYVVLRLETYALLAGAAILFIVLSVVMAATRRLDWGGQAAGA
jgi:inner membrane protein